MAYYVIGAGNNLYEGMTKEQILAAITQAIETHTITDVDTGFVTTIKEKNKNNPLSVWVGTEAEYNAIQNKQPNCLYIKTDDSTLEAIGEQIDAISGQINSINERLENDFKYVMASSHVVAVNYVAANKRITVSGHLSNLRKKITFSIITEKSLEDVTAISPLIFKANIRHVSGGFIGAVDYTDGGVEFYPNSPYTLTATIANNHCITFELEHSTDFTTDVANNTPVGVEINALEFGLE